MTLRNCKQRCIDFSFKRHCLLCQNVLLHMLVYTSVTTEVYTGSMYRKQTVWYWPGLVQSQCALKLKQTPSLKKAAFDPSGWPPGSALHWWRNTSDCCCLFVMGPGFSLFFVLWDEKLPSLCSSIHNKQRKDIMSRIERSRPFLNEYDTFFQPSWYPGLGCSSQFETALELDSDLKLLLKQIWVAWAGLLDVEFWAIS